MWRPQSKLIGPASLAVLVVLQDVRVAEKLLPVRLRATLAPCVVPRERHLRGGLGVSLQARLRSVIQGDDPVAIGDGVLELAAVVHQVERRGLGVVAVARQGRGVMHPRRFGEVPEHGSRLATTGSAQDVVLEQLAESGHVRAG